MTEPEKTVQPRMNAEERRYKHDELTEQIIGAFYEVYNELGTGWRRFIERLWHWCSEARA